MKRIACLLPFIFIYFIGSTENAIWTGAKDNSWSNPENWSTGKVPGKNDVATIPSGTPDCQVHGYTQVGEINNSGTLRIAFGWQEIHTTKFTNSGTLSSLFNYDDVYIKGLDGGKVEIQNTGTIDARYIKVSDGSTVNNSGTIETSDGGSVKIESDVFKNSSNSTVTSNDITIKSNEVKNYGTINTNCFVGSDGLTMNGNTFVNTGTITVKFNSYTKDPTVNMTFKKEFENSPSGKILVGAPINIQAKVIITSPKLDNYGQITGYATVADKSRADTIPCGTIWLISEDLSLDYTSVVKAEKIFLIFHDFFTYDIHILHSMEAVSGIEFRGDKGSLWYILSTCVENLLYSQSGGIRILSDTIRTDSSTLQYLCDPDPITGPSDTNYISGRITSARVSDSSNSSGTFWIFLQNQGTCHKVFQYSISSPYGWITPVSGTTQMLRPFQYDSLEIYYSIPDKPTVKAESIMQTFSVPGIYTDTSYSLITVTDSINLGFENHRLSNRGLDITVYPNPFTESSQIVSNQDATLSIVDIFGRLIYETPVIKGKAIQWFPSSKINPGIYFIHARRGTQLAVKKVVFIR